ncbi:MAG: hypothetical protein U9P80_10540 [Thermodesulfobacteriota bacterium]|nr:hypothetical protein [Thermodesulfobacteriota bacterium]
MNIQNPYGIPIFIAFLLMFPVCLHADGYVIGTYGIGGKISEPSYGMEIGGVFLSDLHPTGGALSLGLGVSVGDTDENPPDATIPPSGLTPSYVLEYNDGNEQDIYMSLGAELVPALFMVAGVGYATQDVITLGRYTDTLYRIDSETQNNVTFLFGLRYLIEGLNAGLGFDSRRGVLVNIGIAF